MRSKVAALVLATILGLSAIALVGCGGNGVEEPTTTTTDSGAVPAPAAPAVAAVAPVDRTPAEATEYTAFPADPNTTPKAILELLESKQPMMVLFYDSTQKTTNDQRSGIDGKGGIDKLMSEYRGTIDLVSYDIGRFVKTTSDGSITIDEKFSGNAAAQQAVGLANKLGVKFTPYIVIVDGEGYVIARFRGFDDHKNIEREVLRATS